MPSEDSPILQCLPVTEERWNDLVRLFEHHGNPGYCWCMRWRAASSEFQRLGGSGRRQALQHLVQEGTPIGVLAYRQGEPVGWCSVAPRETHTALERSRVLKRVDDALTWSVVCFFVDRRFRGQGITLALLQAAIEYARARGAEIVEGYPVEKGARSYTFMGLASTFEQAGFQDVAPPATGRRIMRYVIGR